MNILNKKLKGKLQFEVYILYKKSKVKGNFMFEI